MACARRVRASSIAASDAPRRRLLPSTRAPRPAHVSAPTDCIYHPPATPTYVQLPVYRRLKRFLPYFGRRCNRFCALLSLLFRGGIKPVYYDPFIYLFRMEVLIRRPAGSSLGKVQLKQFTSPRERPVNVICAH